MTTAEIAKLAEHLFHSCVANRLWTPAPGKKQKFTDAVLPILTANLAAREEEYARLREAAKLIYGSLRDARDSEEFTTRGFLGIVFEDLPKLRAALTPQQEPIE